MTEVEYQRGGKPDEKTLTVTSLLVVASRSCECAARIDWTMDAVKTRLGGNDATASEMMAAFRSAKTSHEAEAAHDTLLENVFPVSTAYTSFVLPRLELLGATDCLHPLAAVIPDLMEYMPKFPQPFTLHEAIQRDVPIITEGTYDLYVTHP